MMPQSSFLLPPTETTTTSSTLNSTPIITSNENSTILNLATINNNTTSSFNKDEIKQQIEQWREKYLEKFICPISQQIMNNPVIIETGHTFDKNSIEEWLKSKNTCPITRIELKSKNLILNHTLRSSINENIEKFIKKVIVKVKLWSNDINLFEICEELIDESLDLIKNDNNFKNYKMDLINLKFTIVLNQNCEEQILFDKYFKLINELKDLDFKFLQLLKLENKLVNVNNLQKYFIELLNLIIELKKENNLLKETFTKYCKLNNIDYELIEKVLNYLNNDEIKFEYLIILFNQTNYNRNILLEKVMNIKLIDKNSEEFTIFFKNLFKQINLTNVNLLELITFIENNLNNLQEEKYTIYKELYKKTSELKYLELIYELNKNDKEIENKLLNEYLKLNIMDKYLNLYITNNENNLNPFNTLLLKLLQQQNNQLNTLQQTITNQEQTIENQNKEIIKLNETIKNLNDFNNKILESNDFKYLKLKNKKFEIINKIKIRFPDYDFIDVINIVIPNRTFNKDERFFSGIFEAYGLKWKLEFYPKGRINLSKDDECAIYLHLTSLQCNNNQKLIDSIKVNQLYSNVSLSYNKSYENNFVKVQGWGGHSFKLKEFVPIIEKDTQTFTFVTGMNILGVKFK
ncbi:hypothetical protein ABK040_000531 [Willaertia magna]